MLYLRMMFMMAISLYTSRIVLQTLGVQDYGIYNVVGGFVSLFGFLNGAISSTSSRYITFALGKDDKENLSNIFSTCFFSHTIIAILVLLLAETIGLWFVLNKLIIPADRIEAAMWVYQFSIISAIVVIMSVPYNADIIAHEKMSAFAYISIFEVVAKLIIVYLLYIGNHDKLILYAFLILVIQIFVQQIYRRYCIKHFPESKFHFFWDRNLFKEILSFAGWNLWGCAAGALFTTGLNVLLNMFFGPVVNAARGIAVQVQAAVSQFSQNFQMALNPQITKNYAANNLNLVHTLIERSSKFTFILLLCLSLPIMIEAPFIFHMWLGQVPEYTVIFIRLMLLISIVEATANPIMIGASASGRVKKYQSIVGGILIAIVPISYIVLSLGGAPGSVFIVHLTVALIAFVVRLYLVRPLIQLSLRKYFTNAIAPCVLIGIITSVISVILKKCLPSGSLFSIIDIILIVLFVLIISFLLGLTSGERIFVIQKMKDLVFKIRK